MPRPSRTTLHEARGHLNFASDFIAHSLLYPLDEEFLASARTRIAYAAKLMGLDVIESADPETEHQRAIARRIAEDRRQIAEQFGYDGLNTADADVEGR